MTQYGMTIEEYEEMEAIQDFRCVICKRDRQEAGMTNKSWCIDHNHTTGKIRQLLCVDCNNGIGLFGENVESLRRAIEYLERHLDDKDLK